MANWTKKDLDKLRQKHSWPSGKKTKNKTDKIKIKKKSVEKQTIKSVLWMAQSGNRRNYLFGFVEI